MKRILRMLMIAGLMCGTGCHRDNPKNLTSELPADLIVYNAKVASQTENVFNEAFAVKDGRFVRVGTNEEVMKLAEIGTIAIDARGKTVIPGLNDSHTHHIREGLNYNLELRWDGVRSLKVALQMLKDQAARTPEGQWIRVVGGWGANQFDEKRLPTLEEINEAVPDKPVYILYLYSYGFLNKKGLEELGYTRDTQFPGGVVESLGGVPSGLLIAKPSALLLYQTLTRLPRLSKVEQFNSYLHYFRELNRLGITSAIDAGGGGQYFPDNYEVLQRMDSLGKLTVRTSYYLFAVDKGKELSFFDQWTQVLSADAAQSMLKPNGIQFLGAGENLTWEAADFENFLEPRPELRDAMEPELDSIVSILALNKWPFRIHATYNESITRFLNVFEKVDRKYPFLHSVRWILDHAETIDDANIQRVRELGGGIAIQNRMFFQGEYFMDKYGPMMAEQSPPLAKILSAGIPVGLGTDATRVSSFNPMLALYWAVSGKTWGGVQLYGPENRISRFKALELMTHGSAWFSYEEEIKGYIQEGMLADFAILSDDYFSIPEEDIKELTADITVVNGRVVYAQGAFETLDPELPAVIPDWSPVKFYGGYQSSKKQ